MRSHTATHSATHSHQQQQQQQHQHRRQHRHRPRPAEALFACKCSAYTPSQRHDERDSNRWSRAHSHYDIYMYIDIHAFVCVHSARALRQHEDEAVLMSWQLAYHSTPAHTYTHTHITEQHSLHHTLTLLHTISRQTFVHLLGPPLF